MGNESSNKTIKMIMLLVASVMLALIFGTPTFADSRVLRVDDDGLECPGANFTTIQSAIDAARRGDTIEVCPGTYVEQLVISKPLTLVGIRREGKKAALVQPLNVVRNADDTFGNPQAVMILVTDTHDVTIKNIIVDGINSNVNCAESFLDGIFFKNASGKLTSVVVRNVLSPEGCGFSFAIDFQSDGSRRRHLIVENSSLHDYDFLGIFAFGPRTTLYATGNVITGRGPSLWAGRHPA